MRSRQLKFVFAASPQGGGESGPSDASRGRDFLLHTANRRKASDLSASAADASRLLDAVASPANLATALLNGVRNKGAPGVDGRSVEEVLGSAQSLLPRLHRAPLDGTYQPGDIRRVWIPKPGGGERGLGIPNVIDRRPFSRFWSRSSSRPFIRAATDSGPSGGRTRRSPKRRSMSAMDSGWWSISTSRSSSTASITNGW